MGNQSLNWDGLSNGQRTADGGYRIQAKADGKGGNPKAAVDIVLDTVGPEIDEPELVVRKDGKQELRILVRDPVVAGQISGLNLDDVRIELDSDSTPFASEPSKEINNANNSVSISALLKDLPPETESSNFKIQVLGDGSAPLNPKGKITARDRAGTSTQLHFGNKGSICLHRSSVTEMKESYQKAVRELDKLFKDLATPARQSALPFEITSVGDFSIQAVVKCETGECDTPNLASALVDHYRNLDAKEEAEFRAFHQKVLLQRQIDGYYAEAIAKSAIEGALLFALPAGAEIGLAMEMYQFMKAWRGLSPLVAAYVLSKDYQLLMDILSRYHSYANRAVDVLKRADSKQFCVPGNTFANTRQFERGMVNFSDDFKLKIGTQANEMLLIDEQTFKILNPKALLTGPKTMYVKNSSGNIIGSITAGAVDNPANAPWDHEMKTALSLAKEGYDVTVHNREYPGPDLLLKPRGENAEIPGQIWDLKSSENAQTVYKSFHKILARAKENFTEFQGQPIRLIIDMSNRFTSAEVTEAVNFLRANPKSTDGRYFSQIQHLMIFTKDGKLVF